jgi:ATP-dependent DNA helicase RecQ
MLKSREAVFGQVNEPQRSEKSSTRLKSLAADEEDYDTVLFGLLRTKRKELADSAGVPPYVIFSDKTLVQMAAYFPQTKEGLLNMSGMGRVKYERYGEDFLVIIRNYAHDHKLDEKYKTPMRDKVKEKADVSGRSMAVGEAYNAGETIEALMVRYGVSADTILNHLAKFLTAGNRLRSAGDLLSLSKSTPDQQQEVFRAFEELGASMLKPIHEKLNGRINYDELKILRLCYLCEQ